MPEVLWLYGPARMSACGVVNTASLTGTWHFEYLQLPWVHEDHITLL